MYSFKCIIHFSVALAIIGSLQFVTFDYYDKAPTSYRIMGFLPAASSGSVRYVCSFLVESKRGLTQRHALSSEG